MSKLISVKGGQVELPVFAAIQLRDDDGVDIRSTTYNPKAIAGITKAIENILTAKGIDYDIPGFEIFVSFDGENFVNLNSLFPPR